MTRTTGERLVREFWTTTRMTSAELARAIDRAIAAAVKDSHGA